jgi:hypothetical protein
MHWTEVCGCDYNDMIRPSGCVRVSMTTGSLPSLFVTNASPRIATFDPLLLYSLTFSSESGWLHPAPPMLTVCITKNVVPTVAAINGHCFAAAAIISLACDYRVMTDGAIDTPGCA